MIAKKCAPTKKMPSANYIMEINQIFGKPSVSLKSVHFKKIAFRARKNVHSESHFFSDLTFSFAGF